MIKNEGVLSLLVSLSIDTQVVKTLGIHHFNDPDFYICSKEALAFKIQVTNILVKNVRKPTFRQAIAFYNHVRALLD